MEAMIINQWKDYGALDCESDVSVLFTKLVYTNMTLQSSMTVTLPQEIPCGECQVLPQCQNPDVDGISQIDLPSPCLFQKGEDVIDYYAFDKDNFVVDIIALIAIAVAFRIIGFVAVYARAKSKQ